MVKRILRTSYLYNKIIYVYRYLLNQGRQIPRTGAIRESGGSSSMDDVEPFAFELDLHAYHMLHCDVTITKIVTISSHVIQNLATVPSESFHGRITTTSLVVALFADFLHCLSHCRLSCLSLFWKPFALISPSIMVLDIHIGLGDTSPEPRQARRHYGEYILLDHSCFCAGWLLTHKYINEWRHFHKHFLGLYTDDRFSWV